MIRASTAASWAKSARRFLTSCACVCTLACGAAAPAPQAAPDTAADPLPYTPPANLEASSGEVMGLLAVDNGNVAIDVVRGFFEAAATGTREEIQGFLSDPMTMRFGGRRRRTVPSRRIAQQFLSVRRVRGSLAVTGLVDVNGLEFTAPDPQVPLEADDRAVLVPIATQGRELLGPVLGWTGTSGVVYVRPRTRRIIAF
ncbi:MAG: hypothetical protein AB8H86_00100 [Polyangiales bacterium]